MAVILTKKRGSQNKAMISSITRSKVLGFSLLEKENRGEFLALMVSVMMHKECRLACLIKRSSPSFDFYHDHLVYDVVRVKIVNIFIKEKLYYS